MMRPADEKPLPLIGYRERVALPDLGLTQILAKSDTGAQSSALDCAEIEELRGGRVRYVAVGRRHGTVVTTENVSDIVRVATVRSSNGREQHRFVIATHLEIGTHTFLTEFTLVKRHRMTCRILIGRSALGGRFFVDCENEFLLTRPVRRPKPRPSPDKRESS